MTSVESLRVLLVLHASRSLQSRRGSGGGSCAGFGATVGDGGGDGGGGGCGGGGRGC